MKDISTTLSVILLTTITTIIMVGCSTPRNIGYLQDVEYGKPIEVSNETEIKLQTEDKLSIVVNSKDPLLADMFNLPITSHRVSYIDAPSLSQSQQVCAYTVDKKGEIDFPVLGKLHVAGMMREEIATLIKTRLIDEKLVNDPVVTVEFANLYISVLGEVNKPGRFTIDREKVTLLDAIGMAGDLTIFGQREKVIVFREENGKQVPYKVDLTSAKSLYSSPVFYLQQKDVVYVEPNGTRARQSTVNGNNVRATTFWISIASLLTSMAVLIFK